jgi:hypothetical protein
VETPGGSRSPISKRLDGAFYKRGWKEKHFETAIVLDGHKVDSPTHLIDCHKGRVALEIEWNNKDPFFDRDLNNFRLLFDLRAIDAGVIITRATELAAIFDKLGASTTHLNKLLPRLDGGGGGGCPVLAFAITGRLLVEDVETISPKDLGIAAEDIGL